MGEVDFYFMIKPSSFIGRGCYFDIRWNNISWMNSESKKFRWKKIRNNKGLVESGCNQGRDSTKFIYKVIIGGFSFFILNIIRISKDKKDFSNNIILCFKS